MLLPLLLNSLLEFGAAGTNRFAISSGNFNDDAIWNTLPNGTGEFGSPFPNDTAITNGNVITIDTDINCANLRNDSVLGSTAGGWFVCETPQVITANLLAPHTTKLLDVSNSYGVATIVGNIVGSQSGETSYTIYKTGAGELSTTGNISNGIASGSSTIYIDTSCIYNHVGNVIGIASNSYCIYSNQEYTLNIVGDVSSQTTNDVGAIYINNIDSSISILGNAISLGGRCIQAVEGNITIDGTIQSSETANSIGGKSTLGIVNINSNGPFIYGPTGKTPFVATSLLLLTENASSYIQTRTQNYTSYNFYTANRLTPGSNGYQYNKLIDVEGNYTYIGEANPGSSRSAAVWRIKRIEKINDEDIEVIWSNGSASFNKVWNDRFTYNY